MVFSGRQVYSVILIAVLVLVLPLVIFLAQKRQDIRPRALAGQANLLLSAGKKDLQVGEATEVLISAQLTNADIRASGADILLLYDKNKLAVGEIIPATTEINAANAFTEAVIAGDGGNFDQEFNFLRIALIARKPTNQLSGGVVQIAKVTFKATGAGSAKIKFPDDNSKLQMVGISLATQPTPTP